MLIRCAAIALIRALIGLLLRHYHPELSFSLSAVTLAVILLACGVLLDTVLHAIRDAERILGQSSLQIRPVLKCLGIALTSRLASDLCKDASQGALASALEIAGTLCAAAVSMPTILTVLSMIGGML